MLTGFLVYKAYHNQLPTKIKYIHKVKIIFILKISV